MIKTSRSPVFWSIRALLGATALGLVLYGARYTHGGVAGHGLTGAVEEANDAEILGQFETNVFGLLRVTRAILPQMRLQRGGHVVNLSSIGA